MYDYTFSKRANHQIMIRHIRQHIKWAIKPSVLLMVILIFLRGFVDMYGLAYSLYRSREFQSARGETT